MFLKNNKYSPYAWWLTSASYFNGDVAVLGSLPIDDLYFLSEVSNNLFYNKNNCSIQGVSNLNYLEWSTFLVSRYDAIILSQDFEYNGAPEELRDRLNPGGVLTKYRVINKGMFGRLMGVVKGYLYSKHLRNEAAQGDGIEYSLPCISYDKLPYEAFIRENYNTNKNINRLKENIKTFLLNSRACDLFVNSYINIYYKNNCSIFFDQLINEGINFHIHERLRFTKIYYKYGKLILSCVSDRNLSKYIIVIMLDNSAVLQRRNELKTIKYIKSIPSLLGYVVNNYVEFNYCGLNCVFMDEVIGVTIDEYSNKFDKVSLNIYEIIKLIALNTQINNVHSRHKVNIINRYLVEFSEKLPEVLCFDSVDEVQLSEILDSLCMVTIHGDSKIENYVVDIKYNVLKIIDWELSEVQSFPFLDLIYFIIYNIQIEMKVEFHIALEMFCNNDIKKIYRQMIDDYLKEFGITNDQRKVLLGVFILHHYARRVVLSETVTDEFKELISGYLRSFLFLNKRVQ